MAGYKPASVGMSREFAVSRVASRYLAAKASSRVKTAGEVRFIKDRSGDEKQWGWSSPGPMEREIGADFQFNANKLKPLARALRSTLAALGHVQSAYGTFTKIKSATVSPDGSLGGKGYIQKIPEMRRSFMNTSEALSSLSDTLYDEIQAPHWNPVIAEQSPRERQEVREIMDDVEEIKEDPEEWAEDEESEMDSEHGGASEASGDEPSGEGGSSAKLARSKRAGLQTPVSRVADVYLERLRR